MIRLLNIFWMNISNSVVEVALYYGFLNTLVLGSTFYLFLNQNTGGL